MAFLGRVLHRGEAAGVERADIASSRLLSIRAAREKDGFTAGQLRRMRTRDFRGYSLREFDAHACLFVHIPKCAGVSVARSLFGNLGGGHTEISRYKEIFSPAEFARYFKFTFVRNPWDRLVSAFQFLKQGGLNKGDKRYAAKHLAQYPTFERFVHGWVHPENPHALAWKHFRPQHEFICDEAGNVAVDFVGRFENLDTDFQTVCETIGISRSLPHLNRADAGPRDFRDVYTPVTREIVATVYARDIELFGYAFDDVAQVGTSGSHSP